MHSVTERARYERITDRIGKVKQKADASAKPVPVSADDISCRREAMLAGTMRVLDASFNRAMEGLRVSEDFVRFVLDDRHLTAALKSLRHDLLSAVEMLPCSQRIASRDVPHDVGTQITTTGETDRQGTLAVFFANIQRARQSLRSLEEFGKTIDPEFARRVERLRYRLYTLEKGVASTHEAVEKLSGQPLCVLIPGCESPAAFSAVVEQLIRAGVGMIQLRDKQLGDRTLVKRARQLVTLTHGADVPSAGLSARGTQRPLAIVNDRADIAAAVGADGVHLGQEDLGVKEARCILGPRKLIGVSTHRMDQARTAVLDGANYLGAGPTFPTKTKAFEAYPGLAFLRELAEEIRLPTFAIGGVDADNIQHVLATGITRVALSGAIARARDPAEAARSLLNILGAP